MFDVAVDFDVVVGEVAALTDEALVERFRELERSARRGEAAMAVVVAELEGRSVFVPDGHASMRGWLRTTVRWSNQECQRRLQTARLVVADRAVGARLHAGEVGVAQVQELARANADPRCGAELVGATAETLLDHAAAMSFEEFRLCVRRWESLADADGADRDAESAVERRTATVVEFNGVLHLEARGGAVHAASMVEIFQRFCDAEFATDAAWVRERFGDDAPHGLMPRSDAQRRFDAMWAIFEAAAVAPIDGQAPEPVVNIVVDQVTFETHLARRRLIPWPADLPDISVVDRRCETTGGVLLDPDDVIAAALVGRVRRVVFDSAGVVIDMGRKRRLFAGAAREAVMHRVDVSGPDAVCRPGVAKPIIPMSGSYARVRRGLATAPRCVDGTTGGRTEGSAPAATTTASGTRTDPTAPRSPERRSPERQPAVDRQRSEQSSIGSMARRPRLVTSLADSGPLSTGGPRARHARGGRAGTSRSCARRLARLPGHLVPCPASDVAGGTALAHIVA